MARKEISSIGLTLAINRLETARTVTEDNATKNLRRDFIDLFTLCDLSCKALLEGYQKRIGTFKTTDQIKLSMSQIPSAVMMC